MKYVIIRNKNYYIKYRIPRVLKFYWQNEYFVKSLKTKNKIIAEKNVRILLNKINFIKGATRMGIENQRILELIKDLTSTTFKETEKSLYNTNNPEDTIFALTLEDRLKSYKSAYSDNNYTLVEKEAKNILKSLNITYSKNEFNEVCKKLLENHIYNLKTIFEKIELGKYYKVQEKDILEPVRIIEPKNIIESEEETITLEEAFKIFIQNAEIGESMLDVYPNYFQFLVTLLGKNKSLNNIQKKDFINYKSELNIYKYNNKLLSTQTKKRYIQFTNKFFKHLYNVDLMKVLIEIEQYKTNKNEMIKNKKEFYTIEELKKWYELALNLPDMEPIFEKNKKIPNEEVKWIILLGIFNGFSISEMTRLEKKNIIKVEDIWCIEIEWTDIKRTKNENRIRIIPIHKNLIKLGFLNYVDCKPDGFIFKVTNTEFSRKMTNVNRKYITTNKKRTFHRIRANFINTLVQKGERIEYIATLAGHSQEFKITLNNYSDSINVELLNSVLEKIDYIF